MFLGFGLKHEPLDFEFLYDQIKGSIAVYCRDTVYLLSQNQKLWTVVHKFSPMTSLKQTYISSVSLTKVPTSIHEVFILKVNGNFLLPINAK